MIMIILIIGDSNNISSENISGKIKTQMIKTWNNSDRNQDGKNILVFKEKGKLIRDQEWLTSVHLLSLQINLNFKFI